MSDLTDAEIFAQAREDYLQLLATCKSAILATTNSVNQPEASYAPAWIDAQRAIYVYVSKLAKHTGNLKKTGKVSVLLIEDEQGCAQLFARKRLTFRCTSELIPRGSPQWQAYIEAFADKFGDIMHYLKNMTDFDLFKLTASEARLVTGFGRAFHISGPQLDTISWVGGPGHENENAT